MEQVSGLSPAWVLFTLGLETLAFEYICYLVGEKNGKMTNQAPISRKKGNEKANPIINLPSLEPVLNKSEDLNNIVVMSGTAKRKPLEKKENRFEGTAPKRNFKESFSKLRVPFCKPHHKHAQTEERLMTKSCEVLFECIKPCKSIRVGRRTQVKESVRTFGSILTTDIVYERKATRKVQFFSFSGENPMQSFLTKKPREIFTSEADPENAGLRSWEVEEDSTPVSVSGNLETGQSIWGGSNPNGKTVSSEDFITNAFPDPSSI